MGKKAKSVFTKTSGEEMIKEIFALVESWKEFYHIEASEVATVALMATFYEYITGGILSTSLAKNKLEIKDQEKN